MMAETGTTSAVPSSNLQNGDTKSNGAAQLSTTPPAASDEMEEELSDPDDITVNDISNEDASSLLEPAISRAATRYKSPTTPIEERALIMEELEDGGGSDDDTVTPPTPGHAQEIPTAEGGPAELPASHTKSTRAAGELSLGELPPRRFVDPSIPITPWHAGPRELQIQPPQSSLQGVFSNRTRSLSGGAEALRKLLPKGLPSMAQVGNLFGSSSSPTKNRFATSLSFPKDSGNSRRTANSTASSGASTPRYSSIIPSRSVPPASIRRRNSDDSLLYHSLSRASSLGDDSRFEHQHEQVNSRVKAIRDSLQDRSSFRMPQLPSMPSMPNFGFSMSFLNSTNHVPTRSRSNTDPMAGMLSSGNKKRPLGMPTVGSGTAAATTAKPDAAAEATRAINPFANTEYLDKALETLTGDIVIMGGYRGSVLRSTKTNRQLWVPVKVGLNIRKVDLEVGLEPEDEERMAEKIYSSGMLQNIGPVDISRRLFKRLAECENAKNGLLRVWDYGYDWRLSPHLLSRQLTQFLEKLPSSEPGGTGALVIAHSLGGLITRHVVNHRPELFSGVVYAGVPKSCVNILGPIRNGDAVLLSSRVLTAQVNFTLRTSFVLLPEDGGCFFDINTKEKYPVDFFDPEHWIKYRFSPCIDPPLPPRNQQPQGGIGSLLNMSNNLLSLPISGKKSNSEPTSPSLDGPRDQPFLQSSKTSRAAAALHSAEPSHDRTLGMQMDSKPHSTSKGQSTSQSVSTTVTIPRAKALAYLRRTLSETKAFKQQLHYNPTIGSANRYPPLAVIYGKSIPTVFGAKVDGRAGIPCSDSYDNLAFASGDGVCLAREAMLPEGYRAVGGGRICSDRGHVTLLGDLNAVGRAIEAVKRGRARGIGLGVDDAQENARESVSGKPLEQEPVQMQQEKQGGNGVGNANPSMVAT